MGAAQIAAFLSHPANQCGTGLRKMQWREHEPKAR
jgi:hypothetical protein